MTIFKAASYTKSSELRCNLEILKVSVQYLKYKSNDSKSTYHTLNSFPLCKIVLLLDLPSGFKEILQNISNIRPRQTKILVCIICKVHQRINSITFNYGKVSTEALQTQS